MESLPVSGPPRPPANLPEPTVKMSGGWHCLHLFYRINETALRQIPEATRQAGKELLTEWLNPARPGAPKRMQTSVVAGHKADLQLMLMDEDPLLLEGIASGLRKSPLGPALELVWSFVSISEISEYVPTLEQYGDRLRLEGTDPASPAFAAKLKAYEAREVVMRQQRLFPEFPEWPCCSFYPMNKIRDPHANWYTLPYSERMEMMTEHGKSGMTFAGRVTQVITASTGLDDWEWGVTLWGRTPEYIKEIVYTMRFDQASARYAEFGPFYMSYILPAGEALKQVGL
jgi:hydrogen peroxide-dependent heme synthase